MGPSWGLGGKKAMVNKRYLVGTHHCTKVYRKLLLNKCLIRSNPASHFVVSSVLGARRQHYFSGCPALPTQHSAAEPQASSPWDTSLCHRPLVLWVSLGDSSMLKIFPLLPLTLTQCLYTKQHVPFPRCPCPHQMGQRRKHKVSLGKSARSLSQGLWRSSRG